MAPGGTITVDWSGSLDRAEPDWIVLAPMGAPNTDYVDGWWMYNGGSASDTFDLDTYLKSPDRGRVLAKRAKKLGISDWLVARSARLWGTPNDIGNRLEELRAQGLENLWLGLVNWDLEPLKAVEMLGMAIGR